MCVLTEIKHSGKRKTFPGGGDMVPSPEKLYARTTHYTRYLPLLPAVVVRTY